MHCCGHAWSRREWMWSTLLTTTSAMFAGCGGTRSDAAAAAAEPSAAASRLLREHVSIDVHTHAGPNGITSRTASPSDDLARSMRAGGDRSPLPCRRARRADPRARRPQRAPGTARARARLPLPVPPGAPRLARHADRQARHPSRPHGGRPRGGPQGRRPRDHPGHRGPGLPRAQARAARDRGVVPARGAHHAARPLHPERHRRLPDWHRHARRPYPVRGDVIRACNRLGVVVDVAHATTDTVKQAARVASKPLLLSHTALRGSQGPGRDASRRTAHHPGSRAGPFADTGRLHRDLALLRDARALRGRAEGDGGRGRRGPREHRHRRLLERRALREATTGSRSWSTPCFAGASGPHTAKIVGGNYRRIFAASVR